MIPQTSGYLQCGFDKTRFDSAETWQKILDACGLVFQFELAEEQGFLWICKKKLTVVTSDNPLTGMCRIHSLNDNPRNIVRGWAGYIGVEGVAENVLDFVGQVFMNADDVKNFDSRNRSYI